MPIRPKWDLAKIKAGLERFYATHQRYPTATEIDTFDYLPSSRQIQRRFGGLPALRTELNLAGPKDFTRGEYSSDRARTINKRAHQLEKEVYQYLVKRFGQICVHREYFFTDDRRNRTDFFVYHKNGAFSVDVFHPRDRRNLLGCLNSKMRTYRRAKRLQYPVIFLMMNAAITEDEVASLLANKKNKLLANQQVMNLKQFKDFCSGREARLS